jgi:hypothetical protein
MKKNIVLFILFILPIVAYLFFATGINSFMTLPLLTKNLNELDNCKSLNDEKVVLKDKITILGFGGNFILNQKGTYFNLNQKIYDKNKAFKDFQFVTIMPLGSETQVEELVSKLKALNTVDNWHFVFATPGEIQKYYLSLKIKEAIQTDLSAKKVFIIDKKLNLRGRKAKTFVGSNKDDYKEGYDAASPSDLYNEMADDVKVILAEYRLALKRNNSKRQI